MASKQISKQQIKTLEKPEYFEVVMQILYENNYASKIARSLEKKQPTITEQLNSLERLDIIIPLETKGGAKKFRVNFGVIADYVYSMILEFRDFRLSGFDIGIFGQSKLEKLDYKSIENALPRDLLKEFFEFYAIGQIDLVGGKKKRIDEIVLSFFAALDDLNNDERNRLIKEYEVKKTNFETIIDLMSFEAIYKERVAITTAIQMREKGNKKPS